MLLFVVIVLAILTMGICLLLLKSMNSMYVDLNKQRKEIIKIVEILYKSVGGTDIRIMFCEQALRGKIKEREKEEKKGLFK
jgi:hypothetical protein